MWHCFATIQYQMEVYAAAAAAFLCVFFRVFNMMWVFGPFPFICGFDTLKRKKTEESASKWKGKERKSK